jgi:elongation factor Ts
MKVTAEQIRRLREKTGAPVMRVKKVLEDMKGDEKGAEALLKKEGYEKASKRQGRETGDGCLFVYRHHNGKVVGIVELLCETDFVARNEIFRDLGQDLSMQAASMGEEDFENQQFIKDSSVKVGDLIKGVIAKTGENIRLGRVIRITFGA